MGLKVIPGNGAYGDSYPAFYEGNHGDYYLSLSPIFMPLPFFAVPNAYSWGNPVTSPKVLYPLLGVN